MAIETPEKYIIYQRNTYIEDFIALLSIKRPFSLSQESPMV